MIEKLEPKYRNLARIAARREEAATGHVQDLEEWIDGLVRRTLREMKLLPEELENEETVPTLVLVGDEGTGVVALEEGA